MSTSGGSSLTTLATFVVAGTGGGGSGAAAASAGAAAPSGRVALPIMSLEDRGSLLQHLVGTSRSDPARTKTAVSL